MPPQNPSIIVPLYPPAPPVGAMPTPKLVYNGGPLMQAVEVFTLYIGNSWTGGTLQTLSQDLDKFFDFIVTSSLITQLSEYSQPKKSIGTGKHTGSGNVTGGGGAGFPPNGPDTVSDDQIQESLKNILHGNPQWPQPSANTLYFLFFPPGVKIVGPKGGGSPIFCKDMCGYHWYIGDKIFYAVVPFLEQCGGCNNGAKLLDSYTQICSHELCEAITDPIPSTGWYDGAYGEIGDICAWKSKQVGSYTVQKEWSDNDQACS